MDELPGEPGVVAQEVKCPLRSQQGFSEGGGGVRHSELSTAAHGPEPFALHQC